MLRWRNLLGAGFVFGLALMAASAARAVPALQLDIIGGTYDAATQTVVSNGPSFTVLALATATGNTSSSDILAETYFLSAAFLSGPAQSAGFNAGSFTVGGATVQATDSGLDYGAPPIDAAHNTNLPNHGIFPTYFHEVAFTFDGSDTTATYNAQDDAGGGLFDEAGSGTFFVKFEINVAGLAGEVLHFDLYNTNVKRNGDIKIDDFAPFSHDAQSGSSGVPPTSVEVSEPSTIIVIGLGVLALGAARRRKSA